MAPMGCDLEQRDEHERAPMQLGMRQYEAPALAPALGQASCLPP